MSVQVDVSELRILSAQLSQVPAKVQQGIRPIVTKGAVKIKQEMQSDMRESPSFGQIARSISYDVKVDGDGIEAQVGPAKGRAGGSLANIAYFGSSKGGGGTVPDPLEVLADEADPFEQALSQLLDGVL